MPPNQDQNELTFPFYFPLGVLLLDESDDTAVETIEALRVRMPERRIERVRSFDEAISYVRHHPLRFTTLPSDPEFNVLDEIGLVDESRIPDIEQLAENAENVGMIIVRKEIDEPGCRDFLRKLLPHRISKVLLTQSVDDAAALKAFNSGLIERYVNADDGNHVAELVGYLRILERNFFDTHNSQFTAIVGESSLPFLTDVVTLHELNGLCRDLDARIVAPSVMPPGLYVVSKADARYFILVADEETVQSRMEIAMGEGVDRTTIDVLKGKKHIYLPDLPKNRSLESMALELGDKMCKMQPLCAGVYFSKISLIQGNHATESSAGINVSSARRAERRGDIRDRTSIA